MKYKTELTNERINCWLEQQLGEVLIFDVAGYLRRLSSYCGPDPDRQEDAKDAKKRWERLQKASAGFDQSWNHVEPLRDEIMEENERARSERVEAWRKYYAERDEDGNLITPF